MSVIDYGGNDEVRQLLLFLLPLLDWQGKLGELSKAARSRGCFGFGSTRLNNYAGSLREVFVGILTDVAATAVVLARLCPWYHEYLDMKCVSDTEFQEILLEFETIQ